MGFIHAVVRFAAAWDTEVDRLSASTARTLLTRTGLASIFLG